MDYIVIKEAAEKWGVSERRVQQFCEAGRIPGAVKPSRDWLIPHDAAKPADGRINNRRRPKSKKEEQSMKSYVITITEADDIELALDELKMQLSEIRLLKNTVGIVSVNPEYIHSGIYDAVAKAVPFPLVGMTTLAQTANGKTGMFLFSILMLTSDDCEFAYEVSGIIPQIGDVTELTQKCYTNARSKLDGNVKLALLYAPFMEYRCSGDYIKAISDIDERIPVFGSLANADMENLLADLKTVCCDNYYNDRLVVLLISGNISPEFYIGSITKGAVIMPDIGEVTDAKGNHVLKINDMDAEKFFDEINFFVGDARNQGLLTSIFIVDQKDEAGNIISSTSRGILSINDGEIIFGGNVPTGSVLSVATTTKDMVLTTAKDVAAKIKKKHSGSTVLMYSCIGRRYSCLDEPIKEYEVLNEQIMSSGCNYLASCSCGEICPTSVTVTKAHNIEHNQALIACVF